MNTFRKAYIWALFSFLFIFAASCSSSKKNKKDDAQTEYDTSSVTVSTATDAQDNADFAVISLTAPENLTDGDRHNSETSSPVFAWDSVENAESYELALGTSPGETDGLTWTSVGDVTSISLTGLSLDSGELYYVSVRAVAADGSKGPATHSDGWQNLACPDGYIKIPGDMTPGLGGPVYDEGTKSFYDWSSHPTTAESRAISDFCVMKYEAKDGGSHVAISEATGLPWDTLKREEAGNDNDAQEACENNGEGFELIGNHHWQAIAHNIETVSENYDTSGAEADHQFNQGHSNNNPSNPLAADPDDNNACYGVLAGSPGDDCGGGWHIGKRTHSLSNGEIIWDFSGNVHEWVRDDNSENQASATNYIQQETYFDALKWGPAGDYSAQTGSNKAGLGIIGDDDVGGVVRGGFWQNVGIAGIYYVLLSRDPAVNGGGFRCVYAP